MMQQPFTRERLERGPHRCARDIELLAEMNLVQSGAGRITAVEQRLAQMLDEPVRPRRGKHRFVARSLRRQTALGLRCIQFLQSLTCAVSLFCQRISINKPFGLTRPLILYTFLPRYRYDCTHLLRSSMTLRKTIICQ